jgi:hypothetical protein
MLEGAQIENIQVKIARTRVVLDGIAAQVHMTVGLYRLNLVDPSLESAWLQPLSLPLDPS